MVLTDFPNLSDFTGLTFKYVLANLYQNFPRPSVNFNRKQQKKPVILFFFLFIFVGAAAQNHLNPVVG
jgi:hypothetical protein